ETALDARRPINVEFANVDHRVSLVLNGEEVLATTPEQYAPDVSAVIGRIRDGGSPPQGKAKIVADRIQTQLAHVQL
ncbi:hypothetical protein, partial [Escherichia coli]|uniref:hypothetical protein n=1 Tax=Escherichia coli TaxID=562 RepID=UPI0028DFFF0D